MTPEDLARITEEKRLRKNEGMRRWRERMQRENPEELRRQKREWKRANYWKNPEKQRARAREWKEKNPEKVAAVRAAWYARRGRDYYREYGRKDRKKNPVRYMLRNSRNRAKEIGVSFSLAESDIKIPAFCPVLGIQLESGIGKGGWFFDNSPSIDRVDSSKGYAAENIQVISWRANALKKDATLDEMRRVVAYMERHL